MTAIRKCLAVAFVFAFTLPLAAFAKDAKPIGAEGAIIQSTSNKVVVREIFRQRNNTKFDHLTGSYHRPPYHIERSLGFVSTAAFAGSHPLFTCFQSFPDYFTSRDPNCEGKYRGDPWNYNPYIIGWVSSTAIPETAPLYRCRAGNNHFDSFDAGCEGYIGEGVLGYVFL